MAIGDNIKKLIKTNNTIELEAMWTGEYSYDLINKLLHYTRKSHTKGLNHIYFVDETGDREEYLILWRGPELTRQQLINILNQHDIKWGEYMLDGMLDNQVPAIDI